MKRKYLIRLYGVFLIACCVAGTGKRDKTESDQWKQNTCGTSNAACETKTYTICSCVDCSNKEDSGCLCKEVKEDTYYDYYKGSCSEVSGSASVTAPNFKITVGGKTYLCSFTDPESNGYSCKTQCGREGDEDECEG
jgi:hypothetical protein